MKIMNTTIMNYANRHYRMSGQNLSSLMVTYNVSYPSIKS